MENVVDALRMAGSILLFVIGVSVAVFALTQTRVSVDRVLAYSDREVVDTTDDHAYYQANSDNESRYVELDTIIPSMYRAYKENYRIVFEFPDDYYLYQIYDKDNIARKISYLDLEKQYITTEVASTQFLDGIVYHGFEYEDGKTKNDFILKFLRIPNPTAENLPTKSLYTYLTEMEKSYDIVETLGTYYQEDLRNDIDTYEDNTGYDTEETSSNGIEDVNKTTKRVITYTFIPK